jgi:uncharacterized membrane protein
MALKISYNITKLRITNLNLKPVTGWNLVGLVGVSTKRAGILTGTFVYVV